MYFMLESVGRIFRKYVLSGRVVSGRASLQLGDIDQMDFSTMCTVDAINGHIVGISYR